MRQFDVEPCDARLETGHGPLRDPHRDTGGEAPRVEHPAQALHEGIRLGSPHVGVEQQIHQGAARAQGAAQLEELGLCGVLRAIVGGGGAARLIGDRGTGFDTLEDRLCRRRCIVFHRGYSCGCKRHGLQRSASGALRGEPSAIGADDGHRLVAVEVECDGVHNGRTVGATPGGNGDGVARHEVARVEAPAQRAHDGVHCGAVDAMTAQDATERIVAPHRHAVAVVAERDLCQRDGSGKGEPGAVRGVAAVCAPCRLDEPALPCLDADRNRDALALVFHSEQEPHLAADTHAPQVRLLLDCLADSVGVHGAHTGPAQQDGKAVATPDAEGLQFRLDLNRRGRERCLHRRGRAGRERCDQRERRNAADPTARLAIHTPNKSLHHTRVRRFVSQERRSIADPGGAMALCQSQREHPPPEMPRIPALGMLGWRAPPPGAANADFERPSDDPRPPPPFAASLSRP